MAEPKAPIKPSPATAQAKKPELSAQATRAVAIVEGCYGKERSKVYASFGDNFRAGIPESTFVEVLDSVLAEHGALREVRLLEETPGATSTVYLAGFFERGAMLHKVSLDEGGVLRGLLIRPFGEAPPSGSGPADDYAGKRLYRLPADGQWLVGNGGRDPALNNHVGNSQQWYAYDFVGVGPDDKSFSGDGKQNEDYFAWGRPVLAPADGTIVTVVDGVPDHGPDHTDGYFVPGNLVVIDHGDGEHSFLAHFQRGSIVVKVGAQVKAGEVLGKVGNSGNSSEPHIHWHLASDRDVSRGHGLPIRLLPLLVDGARVEQPAPVRGNRLEVR